MAATGTQAIIWANGENLFCLRVAEICDIEDKCGRMGAVMKRLENGDYGLHDLREVIRNGLIGGGMDPTQAMLAVKRHVDPPDNPLAKSVLLAYHVVANAMVGVPGDEVGKKPPAEPASASSTMTAGSADQQSSDLGQDSDGPQEKPNSVPSGSSVPPLTGTTEPMGQSPNPIL